MVGECIRRLVQPLPSDAEVWVVDLDDYARRVTLDELSPDDRSRAKQMSFAQHARRWLAGRHALRTVLAWRLGCAPRDLMIEADANGKPHLVCDGAPAFNVSRSERVCLIAISSGEPLGIDIERIRNMTDARQLTRTCFTERERREWSSAFTRSDAAFLACWTRKEACLKALGVGLSMSPANVDAGCAQEVRELSVPVDASDRALTVYPLFVDGAVAALAFAHA